MTKINILLASYNGQSFLHNQIESLASQEMIELTLFIADDGSTDDTLNIIQSLRPSRAIKNIQFVNTVPNLGAANIFLTLLSAALLDENCNKHNLFAFCDQDDVWHCDKLIKANSAIEIFDQQLPVLYGGRTRLVNAGLQHIGYSPLFKRLPSFLNVCFL